jgi:hypothetical protein
MNRTSVRDYAFFKLKMSFKISFAEESFGDPHAILKQGHTYIFEMFLKHLIIQILYLEKSLKNIEIL